VAGTDEVRFWIITWGSKAKVLEPESLKKEIRAEAERMLKGYQRDVGREERDDAFNHL
jgi:predicted DNA-binding transcriptional regulator YafY